MTAHRRPLIRFTDAPRGTCRWCGEPIVHGAGARRGQPDARRRWHPACVDVYNQSDPREARRRVRKRDRGFCARCGLDTYALRRQHRGRGSTRRVRELGFKPRKSFWELDHVVPLIDGGTHELSNLQTLCVPCHRAKSAGETRERAARVRKNHAPPPDEDAVDRELDRLLDQVDAANARIDTLLTRLPDRS